MGKLDSDDLSCRTCRFQPMQCVNPVEYFHGVSLDGSFVDGAYCLFRFELIDVSALQFHVSRRYIGSSLMCMYHVILMECSHCIVIVFL